MFILLSKTKNKTKQKVHKNIMISIKIQHKMNTLYMNSENSKTSDSHKLLLNLTDKIN